MDAPIAKRRRTAGAAVDIAAAAAEEVTDAEVEEFCAIMRRMRDVSRRFASCGAGALIGPARAPAWRPSFSWEDFAPPASPAPAPPQRPPVDERVTENATPPRRPGGIILDLNAEPEPEEPATPRPEGVSA